MTSAPLTLPAHSSIMTGQFPPQHGVRDNGGFFLRPEQVTMAELLSAQGFRTGAIVGAFVLDIEMGAGPGLRHYHRRLRPDEGQGRYRSAASSGPANEVVDLALKWMEGVAGQRFFAWLHLYDPHAPVRAARAVSQLALQRPPLRGEVAFTDAQVGRVLDVPRRPRPAPIARSSSCLGDHGESLGEHGEDTHGFFVYESSMHVPLIIRAPFSHTAGRRVSQPVRTVDMMPTVLDLLQMPAPDALAGVSLAPLMTGARELPNVRRRTRWTVTPKRCIRCITTAGASSRPSRSDRYKLIDAPRPELYDLERDPGETDQHLRGTAGRSATAMLRNLRDRKRAMAAARRRRRRPRTWIRRRARAWPRWATSVVCRHAATGPASDRADPKDKISLFNLMTTARDVSKERERDRRRRSPMLRQRGGRGPERDRRLVHARHRVFQGPASLPKPSRYFRARSNSSRTTTWPSSTWPTPIGAWARMTRRWPATSVTSRSIRRTRSSGIRSARSTWIRATSSAPRRSLRQALEIDPKLASALVATGAIAFQRGNCLRRSSDSRTPWHSRPDVRLAHFNLALIAEARGDDGAADAEYRTEIDKHPTAYKAIFNLGRLKARRGNVGGGDRRCTGRRLRPIRSLPKGSSTSRRPCSMRARRLAMRKATRERGSRLTRTVRRRRSGTSFLAAS